MSFLDSPLILRYSTSPAPAPELLIANEYQLPPARIPFLLPPEILRLLHSHELFQNFLRKLFFVHSIDEIAPKVMVHRCTRSIFVLILRYQPEKIRVSVNGRITKLVEVFVTWET